VIGMAFILRLRSEVLTILITLSMGFLRVALIVTAGGHYVTRSDPDDYVIWVPEVSRRA
jgi:hypothetical protein